MFGNYKTRAIQGECEMIGNLIKMALISSLFVAVITPPSSATPSGLHAGEARVCPFVNRVEYLDLLSDDIITFYEVSDTLPLVYSNEYRDELAERCRTNLE